MICPVLSFAPLSKSTVYGTNSSTVFLNFYESLLNSHGVAGYVGIDYAYTKAGLPFSIGTVDFAANIRFKS